MAGRLTVVLLLIIGLLTAHAGPVSANQQQTPPGAPGDPESIALAHLDEHKAEYGLSAGDVAGLVVTDVVPGSGYTVVHVQQRHKEIAIFNAISNVVVSEGGEVVQVGDRFEEAMDKRAPSTSPGMSDVTAAGHAAQALGLRPTEPFTSSQSARGNEQRRELSDGGISRNTIPVRLVYQPMEDGSVRLAWDLTIYELSAENWWQIRIDANTGDELNRNNFVVHEDHDDHEGEAEGTGTDDATTSDDVETDEATEETDTEADEATPDATTDTTDDTGADAGFQDDGAPADDEGDPAQDPADLDAANVGGGSYRVYPGPVEAPTFGGRTLVLDPANATASPFGWHDTNGVAGAEFTTTQGNNVHAYTDTDANNIPDAGSSPDGGAGLNFDFPIDLMQEPSTYRPASVTNLFFWNNYIHDVFYRYGFNEASGNFQVNNYGKGGAGNDDVMAEAQDGSGTNNANFSTPPDGARPRMQMYLGNLVSPMRDGSLDNAVVVHEYGHGISSRLTGGPSNTSCLNNSEQAGEGWSDYFGLVMTQQTDDTATQARGIGTYLFGQPANGPGIRAFPYSTSMTTDPRTYDSIKTAAIPHGVGSTWAAMLWEVHWALTAEYGFSPNLITGNGGNTIAIQLVLDGLKLQPCNPGFVDARNAILLADQNNGGQDQCLLWEAFAKRGLGFSATQGSPSSTTDGTQAFDIPTSCQALDLTKTANPSPVPAGGQITYQLTATNNDANALTGVTITDPVPSGTSYAGSATCAGTTHSAGVVTIPVGTLASGANKVCSFKVNVAASPWSTILLDDDFDAGAGNWTTTHGSGTAVTWGLTTVNPNSAPNAMFAADIATVSDQYLTTAAPVAVTADTKLSFMHSYDTEAGFDGGVVEISTDSGMTWTDLGPLMTENGYNGTLSTQFSNPLGGRQAFTGNSAGYLETVVDLGTYVGQSALVRFRLGTDSSVADVGWRVDDVVIGNEVVVVNTATATSAEGPSDVATAETLVVEPAATVPGQPQSVSAVATSNTSARVSFSAPASNGGSAITKYQAYCSSTNGGTIRTGLGTGSPIYVGNLTTGKTYRCRVRAENAAGWGTYSPYSATFIAQVTPPGQPQNVSAVATSNTSARVSFSAPASNGGSAITKYQAYCSSTNGGTIRTGLGTGSPIYVGNLTTGKTYRCRVRAENAAGWGTYSPYSATFIAQVTPPGQPQNVSAVATSNTSARVSFSAPASNGGSAITKYQAYCSSTNGGTIRTGLGTGSPIYVGNLTTGKTYRCRVRAENAAGWGTYSPYSATFIAQVTPPGQPQNVSAVATSNTSARVSFSAPASNGGSAITKYQAYCSSTNGGTIRTGLGTGSPIYVGNLTTGKTYRCRVRAENAAGWGTYSPYSATFIAQVTPPGQPQNVSAVATSNTSARVSFSAPASNGGSAITKYQAYCSSTNGGTIRTGLGTGSPIYVGNLTTGKTYRCRVRAENSVGWGTYSPYSTTFTPARA